jgi:hypothetical protein
MPESLITALDNATDYADSRVEALEQDTREDIDAAYTDIEVRDPDLWEEMGVDPELPVSDYEAVDVPERDLNWLEGLAGIAAASLAQSYLDNRTETIIKPLAYRLQKLDGFDLTRSQVEKAGKRTGLNLLGTPEYEALQQRYLARLSYLEQYSNAELYRTLQQMKALRTTDQFIADQAGYVARMTEFRPGSTQFKEELAKLIDTSSKSGMRRMSRRSLQRLYVAQQVGDNGQALLTWLVENGPGTCSYCQDNAGVTQTLDEWIQDGMPGAEVCAGGDNCRCQLYAV